MNVVIVGATGYGGLELVRLLNQHPYLQINALISTSQAGESIKRIYPHLQHLPYTFDELNEDVLCEQGELIFFATPPGVSSQWAPRLVEQDKIVIDLSGDFRLQSETDYQNWYGRPAAKQEWLNQAVYGLSECFRSEIQSAHLISNPGCYPTATLLALAPLLLEGWISTDSLIIDAKSGVTGAGRAVNPSLLFSEVNESLKPYKVTDHQHIPEIERFATKLSKQKCQVNFIPHLVPMNRGILVTIYAEPTTRLSIEELQDLYLEKYREAPFIRIMGENCPQTKQVQGSNFCDIGFYLDSRTGRLILFAVIDNLMKGAAGQAIQNANLRLGYREETGLMSTPLFP